MPLIVKRLLFSIGFLIVLISSANAENKNKHISDNIEMEYKRCLQNANNSVRDCVNQWQEDTVEARVQMRDKQNYINRKKNIEKYKTGPKTPEDIEEDKKRAGLYSDCVSLSESVSFTNECWLRIINNKQSFEEIENFMQKAKAYKAENPGKDL